jgi:uncharacterized RDD family membrane protein YckC
MRMATREWWYVAATQKRGPVNEDELRKMFMDESIGPQTLVWKEGFTEWAPIRSVAELTSLLKAVPPQIPTPSVRDKLLEMPLAGRWRRFVARIIDLWILSLPVGLLFGVVAGHLSLEFSLWMQKPGSEYILNWMLVPLVLLAEAMLFGVTGTTIGKAVLGLRVLTVGAARPGFVQYLLRQIGVYWYGLGTGFPLVALFTMVRQSTRLTSGRQTTYDEGKFNVRAPVLGFARAILAGVFGLLVLFVHGLVMEMGHKSDAEYFSGALWHNEVTGRQAQLPSGWLHEKQKNTEGQSIDMFSNPDAGVVMVFAKEDVGDAVDVNTYAQMWTKAVRQTMRVQFDESVQIAGFQALRGSGSMADDLSQQLDVHIVRRGQQMWRTVVVGASGKSTQSPSISDARLKLLSTL